MPPIPPVPGFHDADMVAVNQNFCILTFSVLQERRTSQGSANVLVFSDPHSVLGFREFVHGSLQMLSGIGSQNLQDRQEEVRDGIIFTERSCADRAANYNTLRA